jgi:hypothetical protein
MFMRRVIIGMAVSLVTFAIGVGTNSIWLIIFRSAPKSTVAAIEHRVFRPTERESADGWYKQAYESDDGAKLIVERWERASSYMQYRLEYRPILRISSVVDNQGHKVGERAVALLPSKEYGFAEVLVMWTNGPVLHAIYAQSLADAEWFEKSIQD